MPQSPENLKCAECGHTHADINLAGICVGCPCEWRPDYIRIVAALGRYEIAMHAVQTGVAYEQSQQDASCDYHHKHLRVGVDSAMVTHLAIARLLIAKGIITEVEYHEAVADAAEDEQKAYQSRMPENVTLA